MSEQRASLVVPDLQSIAFGLATSVLTAFVLAFVAVRLHFALYKFSFWGVVPIGAVISGMVAASGYIFATRLTRRRPGTLASASALVSGLLTYVAIYYFEYLMMDVRGRPVSSVLSFSQFIDGAIRATSISMNFMRITGRVGAMGYPIAALEAAGFAFSSIALVSTLKSPPSCTVCGRYIRPTRSASGYGTEADLTRHVGQIQALATAGATDRALAYVQRLPQGEANHKLMFDVSRCDSCRLDTYHLHVVVFASERGTWVPLPGYDVQARVSPSANLSLSGGV